MCYCGTNKLTYKHVYIDKHRHMNYIYNLWNDYLRSIIYKIKFINMINILTFIKIEPK